MGKGKSLLLGFVVGGVVSASATLLSAPKSGEQLRHQAKSSSTRFKHTLENLKDEGKDLTDQIARTSKEGATLLKDLSADVKTSIESWKNTIEPHQRNIQKHLQEIEKSLKELEDKAKEE